MLKKITHSAVLTFLLVTSAGATDCDKALIVSTYSDNQWFSSDWRLAEA
jgi:hypothetical protein